MLSVVHQQQRAPFDAHVCRKDLNYPSTAVDGIRLNTREAVYRKDLNKPSTAVGGILTNSILSDFNGSPSRSLSHGCLRTP